MVRGRRVLGGVILATAAVLGFAVLQWREIAVRWRVAELERFQDAETELPTVLLVAGPGTIAGDVLARYLGTRPGRRGSSGPISVSSREAAEQSRCAWIMWGSGVRPLCSSSGWEAV
jgi:hypothetical protein